MMRCILPWRDTRGTAAAELALIVPLLLLILFGSTELGRYFYSQHILVKAVRDGAAFAAHQPIGNYDCTATPPAIDASVVTATLSLVQTGGLVDDDDLLPQWADAEEPFTMTLSCVTVAGGTTLGGLYTLNNGQVPVITITATLPYQPITGFLSDTFADATISASQQASVIGI